MKFTLSWLKDFLDTSASVSDISEALTSLGLEVESVDDPAKSLKDFIVAEIQEAAPHPNASKLQVCRVFDGTEIRQIVCGAANARAGLKTVLAREGVFIPGSGITIKKTKIRDVESNGMLCSAEELGLDEKSEGILELPQNATPGASAAETLGLNDPIFDIAITPNRADCFGVYGVARDLAAAGLGTLKALDAGFSIRDLENDKLITISPNPESRIPNPVQVSLRTPNCPLFIGCYIKNVTNAPSPAWLQQRLKAIGLRPISALVDITNYFTFTFARPLHVFDADTLNGALTVRDAKDGETLEALNGKTYTLKPGMTVIADESGPQAIGGMIGGMHSGCTETTRNVFLEAAYFLPENIAATGRALELITDARTRFERGGDPAFVEPGAKLAASMIQQLCGGEVSALTVSGNTPGWKRSIRFNPTRVATLGGLEVAAGESLAILKKLGCTADGHGETYEISPPSWRQDITLEADLVEEILRLRGYGHIPATPLPKPASFPQPALSFTQKRESMARRALAARGLFEACTWSFLAKREAELFGGGDERLSLLNPISTELSDMRPSLLPNLLSALRDNLFRGTEDLGLFEVGLAFHGTTPDAQTMRAGGLRMGGLTEVKSIGASYDGRKRPVDAFDAKADVLSLLAAIGITADKLTVTRDVPGWYHPGRSGALTLGGKITLAHFGEIHPRTLRHFGLMDERRRTSVCGFELNLDAVPAPKAKSKAKPPLTLSDFPAVTRDFAYLVDTKVSAEALTRAILASDKTLITDVRVFDVFSSDKLAEGKKSVALSVTLQAADRTLSDAEITALADKINAAAATLGAGLRA